MCVCVCVNVVLGFYLKRYIYMYIYNIYLSRGGMNVDAIAVLEAIRIPPKFWCTVAVE